jgi:hypothetical protein
MKRSATTAAWILFAASAWARQSSAPPAVPVAPAADAQRAARLADDRKRCEQVIAAVDKFGHVDEFAAKLEQMLAETRAKYGVSPEKMKSGTRDAEMAKERFIQVKEGSITDNGIENWLAWNTPREGATTLPALETDQAGHPFQAIVDLDRQLRAHGIDFLLLTFPARSQLYPELFMDWPSEKVSMDGFAGICPATPRFVLKLIDAGVDALYLAPEFVAHRFGDDGSKSDQLFLQNNQHWTPRGALLTATLVNERLKQYPWYQPGSAKEGVDWVTREKDVEENIVWGGKPDWAKPEHFHVLQVVRPKGGRLDCYRPSSPIVLLSGSFADFHRQSDCDFTSHLYRLTGWPIDKVNPRGGVEESCRRALAKRPADELAKKKLVIWMIPEQAFKEGPMWEPFPIFGE